MRDWTTYVRERLHLPDLEVAKGEDAVDEIASQLEDIYHAALERGASEDEARRAAEREIHDWAALAATIQRERGASAAVRVDRGVEGVERRLRDRGGRWLSFADGLQTLRLSMRRMRRTPGFSLIVLITLAFGIGANTAIFSVVNGVLLKPLPFHESDRLVSVWTAAPGIGDTELPQSPAVHLTFQERSELHDGIGLWSEGEVTVLGTDAPARVPSVSLTSGLLRALRVGAAVGRAFTDVEDAPGAPPTVMLSDAYWRTRLGARPDAIGQDIEVNGVSREIIGVMPRDFSLFENQPAIYLPFPLDRAQLFVGNFSYRSVARLADGVTIEQAEAEFTRLQRVAVDQFPGALTVDQLEQSGARSELRPLKDDVVGDVGDVLWLLLGGVGIILIVATANVANLFLVRAETREREFAVRSALGAGRRQISADLLAESLLLGLIGGVLGTALAYGGLRLLLSMAPENLPRLDEITLDPLVLLFTLLISLASGVFFGLFPVLRYRKMNAIAALKEGGRGAGAGKERHRTRNALVVAQMALALVLLVGSGLMIRSFQGLLRVHPGFDDPGSLMSFGIAIPEAEVPRSPAVALLHERIAQRLEQVPGVASVGLATSVPMDGRVGFDPIWVEDHPTPPGQVPAMRRFDWVSPGYLETMGIPLLAGRGYTWDDIRNRAEVVMISESMAREYWDRPEAALGARISTGLGPGNWREVVGVTGDVHDAGLHEEPVAIVYWPMVTENQWGGVPENAPPELALFIPRRIEYVVRTDRAGGPGVVAALREAVSSINPNLPLANPRFLSVDVRESMSRTSFTLVMLVIAAAMALILGAVGVYGVISYVVAQRTREIGVRVVLGAQSSTVRRMVLGQGLRLAGAGIGLGLVSAALLTRLMGGLLYGVSPADPLTFTTVAVTLTAIALLASYVPARRASRVDPIEAIRAE